MPLQNVAIEYNFSSDRRLFVVQLIAVTNSLPKPIGSQIERLLSTTQRELPLANIQIL